MTSVTCLKSIRVIIFVNYLQILIQLIKYFQKLTISTHTKVFKVLGGREENKRQYFQRENTYAQWLK